MSMLRVMPALMVTAVQTTTLLVGMVHCLMILENLMAVCMVLVLVTKVMCTKNFRSTTKYR